MTDLELLQKKHEYARVLVEIGCDLKKGQTVVCESPVEHADFMAILAEEAYKYGAGRFVVLWNCNAVDKVSVEAIGENYENTNRKTADYYAAEGAAMIRIESPDLDTFADVDAEKMKAKHTSDVAMRRSFRQAKPGSGSTIACLPTDSWAKLVFPDVEDKDERMAKMWDAVLSCTRCTEADPVKAWKKYISDTTERKKILDEKKYTEFKYKSAKSDFTVAPAEGSFWMGGCMETPERVYVPNIPTEEVFQTPHKFKVNGTIGAVMPLVYGGQVIEGISLTLKDGRIVDYSAQKGYEVLKGIIETDEGSHYLGEMAFIDVSSPIASQHRVFYTTLYDENASCHVAIGNAYGPELSDEEADKLGFNKSAVHVDFMIGDETMNIEGKKADGTWEKIFENGHWAF